MNIQDVSQRHWELYEVDCKAKQVKPTVSDFAQWLDEEYPE